MTTKYNFSKTIGDETFQVVNCDSFDEAIKIVERAVKDRLHSQGQHTGVLSYVSPSDTVFDMTAVDEKKTATDAHKDTHQGSQNVNK